MAVRIGDSDLERFCSTFGLRRRCTAYGSGFTGSALTLGHVLGATVGSETCLSSGVVALGRRTRSVPSLWVFGG